MRRFTRGNPVDECNAAVSSRSQRAAHRSRKDTWQEWIPSTPVQATGSAIASFEPTRSPKKCPGEASCGKSHFSKTDLTAKHLSSTPAPVVDVICDYLGFAPQTLQVLDTFCLQLDAHALKRLSCSDREQARVWMKTACECCGGRVDYVDSRNLRELVGKIATRRISRRRLCAGCYAVEVPSATTTLLEFAKKHGLKPGCDLIGGLADMVCAAASGVPRPKGRSETYEAEPRTDRAHASASHVALSVRSPDVQCAGVESPTRYWVLELEQFLDVVMQKEHGTRLPGKRPRIRRGTHVPLYVVPHGAHTR
jgi:hypothetical protein